MSAKVINCIEIADGILADCNEKSKAFERIAGRVPTLAVVMVGNNPASEVYVRNKDIACTRVGVRCDTYKLKCASEQSVIRLVKRLAKDNSVDGILVQLPLPKEISETDVLECIPFHKDVDALGQMAQGATMQGLFASVRPCTPSGIIQVLQAENISLDGANVCIINRSLLVGRPLAQMLIDRDATVTVCHSHTPYQDLCVATRRADIIVTAVGKAGFLTADMVSPNAVVIDVGINRDENGKLCGDCAPDVKTVAARITPVPNGIGKTTVAALVQNVIDLAYLHFNEVI